MDEKRRHQRPARYCLHCLSHHVVHTGRGHLHCRVCGRRSSSHQRRRYWTLEPSAIMNERVAKVFAALLALLLAVGVLPATFAALGGGDIRTAGWFIVFVGASLIGALGLATASKLTQNLPGFSPSIVGYGSAIGLGASVGVYITDGGFALILSLALSLVGVGPVWMLARIAENSRLKRLWSRADEAPPHDPIETPLPVEREEEAEADAYCLRCHHPADALPEKAWDCRACGRSNMPSLQRFHWSLHPALRRLERIWSGIILSFPLGILIMAFVRHDSVCPPAGWPEGENGTFLAISFLVLTLGPLQLTRCFRSRRVPWIYVAFGALLLIPTIFRVVELDDVDRPVLAGVHQAWLALALITQFAVIDPGGFIRRRLVTMIRLDFRPVEDPEERIKYS